ncbi:MAG: M48 family metalloprotease [Pseudomonadota bacterium]
MLKLTPILLAVLYGLGMYVFSAWRLKSDLNQKSKPLQDPILLTLTQRLAESVDLPQIKVHVYDIEPVNGLAAPDGRIFITRGFLQKYRQGQVSADELAGVIAHELGHVALGHAKRRLVHFSLQNAMRVGVAMILNRFLPGIGIYVANALASIFAAGLSRNDEYEADAYAAALMTKAGIGTNPQKSLFAKLDHVIGAQAPQVAWLMSHPKTEDRIKAIEVLEKKWGTLAHPK